MGHHKIMIYYYYYYICQSTTEPSWSKAQMLQSLSVQVSQCLSVCLSVTVSVSLSVWVSQSLSVHPSVAVSVCPSEWSTSKGVNWRLKYATQAQQQRSELRTVILTWQACKYKVYKLHQRYILCVPCIYTHARWELCTLILHACQVRVMYLVFTCMPGESYRRWLRSLLLCISSTN